MRRLALAVVLGTLGACTPVPPPAGPPPGPVVVVTLTAPTCARIWADELGRPIDPDGLTTCVQQGLLGRTPDAQRALVHDSAEAAAYRARPVWADPVAGAPLALEPDSDGMICHHELPAGLAVPAGPDRRWWRGDAWGVTVPGLPFVYQGSSKRPERVLTWFYDRWAPTWRTAILQAYRARGYTHFVLSWPDSRAHGGVDNGGQTPAQFVATALEIQAAIPYVAVMLTSKDDDARDADAATRMAGVAPVVDALVAAHVDPILIVGWELNAFNDPAKLQDFIDAIHARWPALDLYVHFTSYVTSWQINGQPRAAFWQRNRGQLTGLLYQGNQNDSCAAQQAHFNDAQRPASGLAAAGAILVPFELVASNQFDGPADEAFGVTRGWELLATPGALLASGFGNGARRPDGAPLLASYGR